MPILRIMGGLITKVAMALAGCLIFIMIGVAVLAAAGYYILNHGSIPEQESDAINNEYLVALRNSETMDHPFPARQPDPQWSYTYSNKNRCSLKDSGLAGNAMTAWAIKPESGDTLQVSIQGEQVFIRLWGIDAPEAGQPGAEEARQTIGFILPMETKLDLIALGIQDNAIIALVQPHGAKQTLNATMLQKGRAYRAEQGFQYAQADTMSNAYYCLMEMERKARQSDRGLWLEHGAGGGERPWEFRQRAITPRSYDENKLPPTGPQPRRNRQKQTAPWEKEKEQPAKIIPGVSSL